MRVPLLVVLALLYTISLMLPSPWGDLGCIAALAGAACTVLWTGLLPRYERGEFAFAGEDGIACAAIAVATAWILTLAVAIPAADAAEMVPAMPAHSGWEHLQHILAYAVATITIGCLAFRCCSRAGAGVEIREQLYLAASAWLIGLTVLFGYGVYHYVTLILH